MNGESYDHESPVCPYCNSGMWDVYYGRPTEMEYADDYVIVTFECVCNKCGKKFHEKRYYFDVDDPEYFPIEENECVTERIISGE